MAIDDLRYLNEDYQKIKNFGREIFSKLIDELKDSSELDIDESMCKPHCVTFSVIDLSFKVRIEFFSNELMYGSSCGYIASYIGDGEKKFLPFPIIPEEHNVKEEFRNNIFRNGTESGICRLKFDNYGVYSPQNSTKYIPNSELAEVFWGMFMRSIKNQRILISLDT